MVNGPYAIRPRDLKRAMDSLMGGLSVMDRMVDPLTGIVTGIHDRSGGVFVIRGEEVSVENVTSQDPS